MSRNVFKGVPTPQTAERLPASEATPASNIREITAVKGKATSQTDGTPNAQTPAESAKEKKVKQPPISEQIIKLAHERILKLVCAADERHVAVVQTQKGKRAYRIDSSAFHEWITCVWYEKTGKPVQAQALKEAVGTLHADATHKGERAHVFMRIGGNIQEKRVCIDLCDEQNRVVEITATGWHVTQDPQDLLVRSKGMLPLPEPVRGGDASMLSRLVNFADDNSMALCWSWLLATVRPSGPYPIAVITAPEHAGKTTVTRTLRRLIDPHVCLSGAMPKGEENIVMTANSNHVLAIDNVSFIDDAVSDVCCRIATGGAFQKRAQYTNTDVSFVNVCKPMVLNGITDFVTRPDLASRCWPIALRPVEAAERLTERQLDARFAELHPLLLGVLCDAVVCALSRLDTMATPTELSRLADASEWCLAGELSLFGKEGVFATAVRAGEEAAEAVTIENDVLAQAIIEFMGSPNTQHYGFHGKAAELHQKLKEFAENGYAHGFPKAPNHMIRRLNRLERVLRKRGIDICIKRTKFGSSVSVSSYKKESKLSSPSSPFDEEP